MSRTHATDRTHDHTARDGHGFAGQHLLIDLFDVGGAGDPKHIERAFKRCVEVAGATLHHVHLHQMAPGRAVSGIAVLSSGQISVHTRPETGYAAFDVFLTGGARAEPIIEALRDAFSAGEVVVKSHRRGEQAETMRWPAAVATKKPAARLRKARAA